MRGTERSSGVYGKGREDEVGKYDRVLAPQASYEEGGSKGQSRAWQEEPKGRLETEGAGKKRRKASASMAGNEPIAALTVGERKKYVAYAEAGN